MRKRILITIPRVPYPLNSGGRIAIYYALETLAKHYLLTIVIIDDDKSNIIYVNEMNKFSDNVYFFTKKRIRFILSAFRGLIYLRPLQVGYFYFNEYQIFIDKLAKGHDFFYSFMIRTSQYGVDLNIKKGIYAIDSMYLNYKKSVKGTRSIFWKLLYKIEMPLLYRIEKKHIEKFNITSFVNKHEAHFWQRYGHVVTLPHGVEDELLNYNNYDSTYSDSVVFIGRMDYQPNIDAVMWFIDKVLPLLRDDVKFKIIGGFPTQEIINLQLNNSQVEVLGYVEDPYIILRSSICTVAPMKSGGGLQTKVLTAMAVSGIVVLSSACAEAIEDGKHGHNLIIEDSHEGIAKIIHDIKENPCSFKHIRQNANTLIRENYSLSVISSRLISVIESKI
jgi:glycosyltransferase involved in cell wall biosynthesis